MDLDTGAGRNVVVLVPGGAGDPGVRPAVAGAGGGIPCPTPGQAVGALVLVVTETGAGGRVVVLEVLYTVTLLLPAPAGTIHCTLHLHLPTHRLMLPHIPAGHSDHHLEVGVRGGL